jgi:glycosyltransferase involved in cell wall biosynthesis
VEPSRRINPTVSVVIATAALPERRAALLHAVECALNQTPQPTVIVVVNGVRFDRQVYAQLERESAVTLAYSKQPSYPAAQRLGRTLVRSEYCCFLDDDDELLPGSIESRVERAERADRPDVIVSAGYRRVGSGDVRCCDLLPRQDEDLRLHLLRQNWFASCAPLMRCQTVDESFFDGTTRYFEWTLIAFRLIAAGKRFAFVDQPGFRINESPISLSKEAGSIRSSPDFVHKLLSTAPPEHVRRALRRRLSSAHHACANLELVEGRLVRAWRHHLSSLAAPGGFSYLLFTRHLVAASLGLRRSAAS